MSKKIISRFAAIATVAAMSQAALAADGQINFTGEITDSICSLTPDSQNLTVPLGKVSRTAFPTVGTGSTPAKFTLNLADCPAGSNKAKVTFSGTADSRNVDLVAIDGSGTGTPAAQGVGIQIGDWEGQKIALGSASREYALAQGTNKLQFQARYVSTLPLTGGSPADPVLKSGPANGTAQFTVAYN
ncbi:MULTISPECIES: fimbrial protein [unclassified Variovorax]|jgi:type 1 fimbria pilin|uniref:fimbrial protein n=1 Tax=unclassified Variovorax TaxID=663243 RepID=UPI0008EA1904|nr:fimbrial protein [Variovorax sp. PDC80]SFP32114.1 major type 1 subunit fimbrin (pilin) [Variovorax sp. PDC80]